MATKTMAAESLPEPVIIKSLRPEEVARFKLRLEDDSSYLSSIALVTTNLASASTCAVFKIPPPDVLALLVTMLVHPSTINTAASRQASSYLSRVLDVASPSAAKFDQVFMLTSQKRRTEDEDDDFILQREGLMSRAQSMWYIIEWAFHKGGKGGWTDLICLIVRILGNDFDGVQEDLEELGKCILVSWLRDSGGKAAFGKAIMAITATQGAEMMNDIPPRGIYDDETSDKRKRIATDIWGGSILLHARIAILSMMYRLCELKPEFLPEEPFLDGLVRRLIKLEHKALYQFLSNIPSRHFRSAICEIIAQQTAPESQKLIKRCGAQDFDEKLFLAYLPALPPRGYNNAEDLMVYCIVTGFLFRGWVSWTEAKGGFVGLEEIVDEVIQKRQQRLIGMPTHESLWEEAKHVVRREGRILKLLTKKIHSRCGCV